MQIFRIPDKMRNSLRWICPDCGGEYSEEIADREVGDNACPYCYGASVKKGYNDLAITEPELTKEWALNNDGATDEVR